MMTIQQPLFSSFVEALRKENLTVTQGVYAVQVLAVLLLTREKNPHFSDNLTDTCFEFWDDAGVVSETMVGGY
jgi:hypothetical protein